MPSYQESRDSGFGPAIIGENMSAFNFDSKTKGTRVGDVIRKRPSVEEVRQKAYLSYLRRVSPEKVYTLSEQIAFINRKISKFETAQPKLSPYTRYKLQYLSRLQQAAKLEEFNKSNVEGFKTTFADLKVSKGN